MTTANEKPAGVGHHEFVPAAPASDPLAKTGYVQKDYEHQEYPKSVGGVVVNSIEEEAALKVKPEAVVEGDAV